MRLNGTWCVVLREIVPETWPPTVRLLTQKDISQCSSHTLWVIPEWARLISPSQWEALLNMKPELRMKSCFYSSDKEIHHKELKVDVNPSLLSRDELECCFTGTILWLTSSKPHSTLKLSSQLRMYLCIINTGVFVCAERAAAHKKTTAIWIKST